MRVLRGLMALLFSGCLQSGGDTTGSDMTVGDAAAAMEPPATPVLASNRLVLTYTPPGGRAQIDTVLGSGTGVQTLIADATAHYFWPRVSPDRTKILFYKSQAQDDYINAALLVMNADGSGVRTLIANGANGWAFQGHGEWSPDGKKIVMCGTSAGIVHLFTTDSDGNAPKQLTTTGNLNCDPSWSPDGKRIVFNRCTGINCGASGATNLDLFTINAADGSGLVQLTAADAHNDYDPYYSPDGSKIAWLYQVDVRANGGVGSWAVKIMNADGSAKSDLINDGQVNSKPGWSLDGSLIFFHRLVIGQTGKFRLWRMAATGAGLTEIAPYGAYTAATVGSITYPTN